MTSEFVLAAVIERLHRINPCLVYASGSGYGLTGPDRDNLAMDLTIQAVSGLIAATGFPDEPPVKAGPAVVDFISGIHLYAATLTALFERERTGRGRLVPADAGTPQEAARHIGAVLAALGALLGEGAGAAAALWLALAPPVEIGSVVLAAPDGVPDQAFRGMQLPALVLCGTKDGSDTGDRYRTLLPDCHFMFVYDAGRAIGAERPQALAFIALEFFERRDLFLVSRESGMTFP